MSDNVRTYTLADFLPGSLVIRCQRCQAEMATSVRMDGRKVLLGLRCPGGHERNFEWPIGGQPPPEAMALLRGRIEREEGGRP